MRRAQAALAAMVLSTGVSLAAPLEVYGRLPTTSDVTLSPDGRHLAVARTKDAKSIVAVYATGAKENSLGIDITGLKLRSVHWADDNHLIVTTSITTLPRGLSGRRGEYFLAQDLDIRTSKLRALLDRVGNVSDAEGVMNVVLGAPETRVIDGHSTAFVHGIYFPKTAGRVGLFQINLDSGATRLASRVQTVNAEDWVIDDKGQIVAEEIYDESAQHWKLKLYRDGVSTKVADIPAAIESPEMEGLNDEGTAVVIWQPAADSDGGSYSQVNLADGTITPWAHSKARFGNVLVAPYTGRVIGGTRIGDRNDYVYFDPDTEAFWLGLKGGFPGAVDIELVSYARDHSKAVLRVFGPLYGDGYYLIDIATHRATLVGRPYDGLDVVAPVKWIDYKAGDGRSIHAYLTTPVGREAKNLPLIVLPHGGPHSRDYPGFDWMSQALASRGYAVLQPQFRGSNGFTDELLEAGYGEFGRKMQTDLSDGVRALAAQGLIDPKRVCIVGASYGGYAALAGATLDTGVYRCAVSIAGLSDLKGFLRKMHWPHNGVDDRGTRFWDRFLGVEDASDPKLDAISPIKHIDKVTIPILLIHGKDDTVVPFDQSDDMADALKEAKKPVEFVTLKGEDHWLSKSETRLQMLQATVNFLEANNPPQ